MRTLIAYIRVSSIEQGKSGIGLEVQRARIQAFAAESGFHVIRTYEEVASAVGGDTVKDRPQLRAALRRGARLGCPVAMTQPDRLSRSAPEFDHLLSRPGHDIIFVRDADEDIRIKTEAAGIQRQTELLKKRTREGIQRAKKRGVPFGNRVNLPIAQKKGAQANQNAAKARLADLAPTIASIQAEGLTTGADIAKRLNELGKRTPRGQDWTDANTRRVLRDIDREESARQETDSAYRKVPGFGEWG